MLIRLIKIMQLCEKGFVFYNIVLIWFMLYHTSLEVKCSLNISQFYFSQNSIDHKKGLDPYFVLYICVYEDKKAEFSIFVS